MGLNAGYYYITLGSFTATLNPTKYSGTKADKKIVNVTTLTQTVKQHWQKKTSDKFITMSWGCLDKADVDALKALDEANYTSYAFTNIYNESFQVVIALFDPIRLGTLDSDGFSVQMRLEIVS